MGLADSTLALHGVVFSVLLMVGNCSRKQVLSLEVALQDIGPVVVSQGGRVLKRHGCGVDEGVG